MTTIERILSQDYSVLDEITLVELKEMEPLFETESVINKYVYTLMVNTKTQFDELTLIEKDFKKLSKLPHIQQLFIDYDNEREK